MHPILQSGSEISQDGGRDTSLKLRPRYVEGSLISKDKCDGHMRDADELLSLRQMLCLRLKKSVDAGRPMPSRVRSSFPSSWEIG